jgi:hypothetical protein
MTWQKLSCQALPLAEADNPPAEGGTRTPVEAGDTPAAEGGTPAAEAPSASSAPARVPGPAGTAGRAAACWTDGGSSSSTPARRPGGRVIKNKHCTEIG